MTTTGMAWWLGHGPVRGDIVVGDGVVHEVRWRDGEFVLTAHPEPTAERALAALGGDGCICLGVHAAWHAQLDDPSILAIGRRRAGEELRPDPTNVSRFEREEERWRNNLSILGVRAQGSEAEHRVAVQVGLHRLLSLHPDFEHRLQLTVVAAAEDRWDADDEFRARQFAAFAAALAARAVPALAAAGLAVEPSFVELLGPREEPVVVTGGVVRLPLRWLTHVWGRGVACVDGMFVTDVEELLDGGRRLLVATAGGGKHHVARGVGLGEDDWRITRA